MAFQPFGYRFEIKSPKSPAAAKEDVKRRLKGWFEGEDGARGWFAGRLFCLWESAYDSSGPMVIGRITADGLGSRISGRAGSDLNGMVYLSLIMGIGSAGLVGYLMRYGLSFIVLLIIGGLGLMMALMLWQAHHDRKDAERLVRFLDEAATGREKRPRPKRAPESLSEGVVLPNGFTLTVNAGAGRELASVEMLQKALLDLGSDGFLVVDSGPETYMQTMAVADGLILEKREGSAKAHFQAVRADVLPGDEDQAALTFSIEEALQAFVAYASGSPAPDGVSWRPMRP